MKPKSRLGDNSGAVGGHFTVTGSSISSLLRQWRPALPKKKQETLYVVSITAAVDSVKFAIIGAAISLPAMVTRPFVAEIPFPLFRGLLLDPFGDTELVVFDFSPGTLIFRGVTYKSPQILFQQSMVGAAPNEILNRTATVVTSDSVANQTSTLGIELPAFLNPIDVPMGLPLLGAYAYIRKYGIQRTIQSNAFVHQQEEVDTLLNKAARLLQPVAITRSDLERLLDRKIGID